MRIDIGQLVAELKVLRKGRGLDAPDILVRVGPALTAVFGLDPADDPAEVRSRLVAGLKALSERLPADFAEAVVTAFGLTEGSRTRLYGDRVALLATSIDRDRRTALRRIDDGVRVVAEFAIADLNKNVRDTLSVDAPWRTTALRTWVVLDREVAEIYEMRRIVTSEEELSDVRLEVSVPLLLDRSAEIPLGDPEIVILHGGTLRRRMNYTSSRVVFDLELAQPLGPDSEHEFFVCYRFSGSRRMEPFYMCTPSFPCESFDLNIRFGHDRLPRRIWRVDGLRMSEVNDSAAPRQPISVNAAGEVSEMFRGLIPNLSFGIAWEE